MSKHSTLVGGSTADRLLNCAASFQLIQRMPDMPEAPSEYANYGSAMHRVMDTLMGLYADGFPMDVDMKAVAREMIGQHFFDRELEQHHLTDSIYPAIDTLYELMGEYGGARSLDGFRVVANELTVKFPGIPGAFGTSDLLLANKKFVLMVDWKFGQGVPVKAVYKDSLGERVNPQLLFYFAGAMAELPKVFSRKRFVVAIIQPRTEERLTHTVITRAEVSLFIEDMDRAVVAALDKNAQPTAGDHCRWCPARPHCPAHTMPLFELTEVAGQMSVEMVKASAPAGADDGSYGVFLAKAKYLADMAYEYKRSVDEQMHAYLEAGGVVPGWRLKLKTKLRQWVDPEIVVPALAKLGFSPNDIWQEKLQTFAHADKVAKRLGVTIPDHLRVAPPSDETTLAATDDPAPVVDRKTAALEFQTALQGLLSDK